MVAIFRKQKRKILVYLISKEEWPTSVAAGGSGFSSSKFSRPSISSETLRLSFKDLLSSLRISLYLWTSTENDFSKGTRNKTIKVYFIL